MLIKVMYTSFSVVTARKRGMPAIGQDAIFLVLTRMVKLNDILALLGR